MILSTSMPLGNARINGRFVAVGRGHCVIGKQYRGFKEALAGQVTGSPLRGPVIVSIHEHWERTCREAHNNGLPLGDVDSPIKCILDALKLGGAYVDDSQVVQLVVSKWPRPDDTVIEVIPW